MASKTLNQIVEELAKDKVFEELIDNISKGKIKHSQDLAQDLYLALLSKNEAFIQKLYEANDLRWFLVTMVRNNVLSVNSPYYYGEQRWDDRRQTYEGERGENNKDEDYD